MIVTVVPRNLVGEGVEVGTMMTETEIGILGEEVIEIMVVVGIAEMFRVVMQASGADNLASSASMLDARTVRCLRFLSSVVLGMSWEGPAARARVVSDLVEAATVNLHLEHALDVPKAAVAHWLGVDALVGDGP